MNEERNIVIEDEGVKGEPSEKLTPEEVKLLEAAKVKKLNKKDREKYTAKKEAQAEAEKIKAELAVAAAAAEEKRKKVLEENRRRDIREANEEKKLAKALKPYKGRRI